MMHWCFCWFLYDGGYGGENKYEILKKKWQKLLNLRMKPIKVQCAAQVKISGAFREKKKFVPYESERKIEA